MFFKDIAESGERAGPPPAPAREEAMGEAAADSGQMAALIQLVQNQGRAIMQLQAELAALRQERNGGIRLLQEHEPLAFVIEEGGAR